MHVHVSRLADLLCNAALYAGPAVRLVRSYNTALLRYAQPCPQCAHAERPCRDRGLEDWATGRGRGLVAVDRGHRDEHAGPLERVQRAHVVQSVMGPL